MHKGQYFKLKDRTKEFRARHVITLIYRISGLRS